MNYMRMSKMLLVYIRKWGEIMRVQTLKSYTRDNLENYLKSYNTKTKRLSQLLLLSENDIRLAELSQAFFFSNEEFEKGNHFSVFTNEEYFSNKEFLSSNSKYVDLFNRKKNARVKLKNLYRDEIEDERVKQNYSYYKLSKLLKVSQSNIDCFFKKNDNKKISNEKLEELISLLKENKE